MTDADLEQLSRDVRTLTSVIARLAHTSFEQQLNQSDLGVSPVQFAVMRSLYHTPLTISDLSRKFVVDPSTLVPVIDHLERKGLAQRNRDPRDRRRAPVGLTEAGAQLMRRGIPGGSDDPIYMALAQMGVERARQLHDLLQQVLKAMPEGESIYEHVQSRLNALSGAEAEMQNSPWDGASKSTAPNSGASSAAGESGA